MGQGWKDAGLLKNWHGSVKKKKEKTISWSTVIFPFGKVFPWREEWNTFSKTALSLKLTEPECLQWLMDIYFLLMGSFLVHCRRAWSGIYSVALTNSPVVVLVWPLAAVFIVDRKQWGSKRNPLNYSLTAFQKVNVFQYLVLIRPAMLNEFFFPPSVLAFFHYEAANKHVFASFLSFLL